MTVTKPSILLKPNPLIKNKNMMYSNKPLFPNWWLWLAGLLILTGFISALYFGVTGIIWLFNHIQIK